MFAFAATRTPTTAMSFEHSSLDTLARLARLRIEPEARAALAADLAALAGLVGRLAAVPTAGVEPLTHPDELLLAPTEDVVTEGNRADELLALSDAAQGGYYAVPKVIE
jgi:aspartyl-tRNA(Asn)/glutamyl-tRNA(Gln) amidotransferase subunit C